MSTRQYIGARYVPKFANPIAWDSANSYEALEIVTYNNTSYTSKKPVPVGVAITNNEYWVATGNYNAQVEQYRQEVETLAEKVVVYGARSVKDYGAVGDGVTDDTAAIKTAIQAVNSEYPILYFPAGTYLVSEDLTLHSNMMVLGDGVNSVVQRAGQDDSHYWIFSIYNLQNVTVKNIKIVGDKNTHTGSGGEWGFGIAIYRSDSITVDACSIVDCWGDGIYVGSPEDIAAGMVPPSNIIIKNCVISGCRRQGISVTCVDGIVIRNCKITDISGTAPQSGIDFETNRAFEYYKNALVEDCYFANNNSDILVMSYGTHTEVTIRNCRFNSTFGVQCNGGETETSSGYCIVENCVFNNFNACLAGANKPDAVLLRVFNCDFYVDHTYGAIRFQAPDIGKINNVILEKVRAFKNSALGFIEFNGAVPVSANIDAESFVPNTANTINCSNDTLSKNIRGRMINNTPLTYATAMAYTLGCERTVSDIYFPNTESVVLAANLPKNFPITIHKANNSLTISVYDTANEKFPQLSGATSFTLPTAYDAVTLTKVSDTDWHIDYTGVGSFN